MVMSKRIWIFVLFIFTFSPLNTLEIQSSEGEDIDCVDIKKQPAFGHSLLQNHNIQELPSRIPSIVKRNKKNHWQTMEAHVSTANCPHGTVPVRKRGDTVNLRTKPTTGNNTRYTPQHEYAEVLTEVPHQMYGTKATINVWDPTVENNNELSIAQIWITSGGYETNDLNTIEAGWQVCPSLYEDNKPRLFVYWTSDAYHTTGGYNLEEPGFIQTSRNIILGGLIAPISTFGSSQYEFTILVWKDNKSRNWWLSFNNILVGYWPAEIFTSLADHATSTSWGGEIVDSKNFNRSTKTQMGSGHFSEEGFRKASYIRNIEIIGSNHSFQLVRNLTTHVDGIYYNIKTLYAVDWGTYFFYGGPGFTDRHSGTVPVRFTLLLFILVFVSFIIT